jgi:hypothetical protein
MSMPDPGTALHLASLDYACTFSAVSDPTGLITFAVPDPVHFTFDFETGSTQTAPGQTTITSDTSWFVQATVEAGITSALGAICTAVAAMLGVAELAVSNTIAVRRVWTIAPNVQGAGVSSGRIVTTDLMPYVPS